MHRRRSQGRVQRTQRQVQRSQGRVQRTQRQVQRSQGRVQRTLRQVQRTQGRIQRQVQRTPGQVQRPQGRVPPLAGHGCRCARCKGVGPTPKISKAVFKARLLTGGAADLLLKPCPVVMVAADEDMDELAIAPGLNVDIADRRKKVRASASFFKYPHANFDSKMEQIMKVQMDFLKGNPEVKEKYKHLVEKAKEEDVKILEDGTYSLSFANNQSVVFGKPKIMSLRLNENEIKKYLKKSAVTPPEVDGFGPTPYDAMQAKMTYEYTEKVNTNLVVSLRKQCGNGGGVKATQVVGMADESDDNLNVYSDVDAEELLPD